jgi:hypothetical protein
VYVCNEAQQQYGDPKCQEVRGMGLDAEVERLLLEALQPDQIALALAALDELEQEYAVLSHQRELHLERLRYEAERTRRQYDVVEPENRLVARTLENRWEQALRALEQAEQEHQAWLRQQQLTLTADEQQQILALGQELPAVWHAASTQAEDRKHILRLVIREVIVDQKRIQGKVHFRILWQTGAVTEYIYQRRVHSYTEHADWEVIQQRIRDLHSELKTDGEIAVVLNEEGFQTSKLAAFNSDAVWWIRKLLALPSTKPQRGQPLRWADGTYSVRGVIEELGVCSGTVYNWLKNGRLEGHQSRQGAAWKVVLTPDKIEELQAYLLIKRSRREAL